MTYLVQHRAVVGNYPLFVTGINKDKREGSEFVFRTRWSTMVIS